MLPDADSIATVSLSSDRLYERDSRLDASSYANSVFEALDALESAPYPKKMLGTLCGTIWHPVQTQARTNFKRVYTLPQFGVPFVSSRNMFDLPLRPTRFLSRR